jgi:hypothetical protein
MKHKTKSREMVANKIDLLIKNPEEGIRKVEQFKKMIGTKKIHITATGFTDEGLIEGQPVTADLKEIDFRELKMKNQKLSWKGILLISVSQLNQTISDEKFFRL